MADSISLSRATSLSRASTQRSRSLIKKSIESQDVNLNAADLLIERFTSWKIIVRQLVSYFEGMADIHNNTAREMTKLSAVIQVPFRAGNQFLGEGGLQDVFYGIRDKSKQMADSHADLGRTIDSSIVQHLQKLLVEVKAHLKNVQNDTAKLAASVAKERELSTKLIGNLSNDITTFRNTPMEISAKMDPYIANKAVARQLRQQVQEENRLQKSIIMMQQNSAHFEEGIVRAIQSAWQTFDEWQSRAAASDQMIYRSLAAHLASLPADKEWISFAARSDHLLDPETPLRDPYNIRYPYIDDPTVIPTQTGHLERKRRFTRNYEESYYVLTPVGFLHAFGSSDPTHPNGHGLTPTYSLFLPNCTLGPPSAPKAKGGHKFHIEGRKDGTGTTKTGRGILGGDNNKAWTFRCKSREEMMEWWNSLRMLCSRYLVASEPVERNGPVEAAVRAAGYEDLEEEEEDGSSVEEEVDEGYHEATEETKPPGYTYGKGYYGVEMTPEGYVIEKKQHDTGYDIQGLHGHHSLRQQEKAPEGQAPHSYYMDRTEAQGDGTVIDQDTTQSLPHGGETYETTHLPPVGYSKNTGYIPEGLGHDNGYVEQATYTVPQPTDSPRHTFVTSPSQTYEAARLTTLSPQPGAQRALSPRGSTASPTHSHQSLRQATMSPYRGSPGPRQGGASPRPISPRGAASSPVPVGGTLPGQYTHIEDDGYAAPDVHPNGRAPVEV